MKTFNYTLSSIVALLLPASGLAEESKPLPDAAKKQQQAYLQQIQKAIKPIRERYLADLGKLQEQSTKAGKLDDAIALRKEIESVRKEIELVSTEIGRASAQSFIGQWTSSTAATSNGGTITIRGDGTAGHSPSGATATWDIQDKNVVFKWNVGCTTVYPISDSGDKMHGKETNAQGKSYAVTLTRIP